MAPRRTAFLLLAFFSGFGARAASAATPLTTIRVASGLNRPLFVTAPPGDTSRVFIVEQRGSDDRGRIKILKNGIVLPTDFLTTGVLSNGNEEGLLGMAFAPDYAQTGRFYINYTDSLGNTQIERRTVSGNPDVANPAGTIVLSVQQPYTNHNGGWLGFGPDGYLYLALGDGGDAGDPQDRAQNVDSLLGKVLRLDVSGSGYTIPPGNPFAGSTPGRDEIWMVGLRNPWRPSFDRKTGDFIIADVGQTMREEIDFAPAGTGAANNFGWRCFEGFLPYAPSTTIPCGSCAAAGCPKIFPIFEYPHTLNRCSITGGYVYRGCAIPDLQGQYFFGDYCGRQIYSGVATVDTLLNMVDRTVELAPSGATIGQITSFGEDARGELYITDLGGQVFKIVPKAPVLESDMPALRARTALGDTLGSTAPGNALVTGVTAFADAGSRIRGVGYLKNATIRECTEIVGSCLTSHTRVGMFDVDLSACVDSGLNTLTRRFVFTNRDAVARPLAYVDAITPKLKGDPDAAMRVSPAGGGQSAVLAMADAFSPDRWIVHSGRGSVGVVYSADVDTASQLVARIAADQPLAEGTSTGAAAVGLALGFDFGLVAPAVSETVTVTTSLRATAPSGVDETAVLPAAGELRLLGMMPFRSDLQLEVKLGQAAEVSLDVFDTAGRRVRALAEGVMSAGTTWLHWDGKLAGGKPAASGVYFIKLTTPKGTQVKRAVLVR